MNNIDNTQTVTDRLQTGTDQQSARPLVDMSDPNIVREAFGRSNGQGASSLSAGDHLTFSNPFEGREHGGWAHTFADRSWQAGNAGGGWRGGENGAAANSIDTSLLTVEANVLQAEVNIFGQIVQNSMPGSATENIGTAANDSTPPAASGSDTGSASGQISVASLDQQIQASLLQIGEGLQQISNDIGQIFGGSLSAQTPADATAPTTAPTAATPIEATTTPAASSPTDGVAPATTSPVEVTTAPAASTPTDTTTAPTATTPTDTTTAPAATTSTDSTTAPAATTSTDSTTAPAATTSTDSTTAPAATTSTDSTTAPPTTTTVSADVTPTPTSGITLGAAQPTSSDEFIAQLQLQDPTLAKTLTDASSQLSAAGYSKLEKYIEGQGLYGAFDANQNYDAGDMNKALTTLGLSAADQSALTNVLNSDMPAALAADPFLASIQQSDPLMAKVLTDASKEMSKAGYGTLEYNLENYYSGNANGTTGLPDQAFLDGMVMKNGSVRSGLDTTDDSALTNVLTADLPSAVASDTLVTSLQQTDPTLANTLSDASSKLSAQGYTQLENYIEENSTWNTANDNSLMNQALSQGGLSSSDANALSGVLQSDMPAALTDAPSAAVLDQMAEAKFEYQNEFALQGVNMPTSVAGNIGKSGVNGNNDGEPSPGVDLVGEWGVVVPENNQSYDKTAQVDVEDPTVYLHEKTGGWVEVVGQNSNSGITWEGNFADNFQSNAQGDMTTNADGSVQFTAPPTDYPVDHFGVGGVSFNPNLYDGVYETMTAKTNVANSGLAMEMGVDQRGQSETQYGTQLGEANWIPLTTNWQTMSLTSLPMSEIEADPPPGL